MKRNEIEYRKKILKIKKEKFIEAVVNSAESLGIPIPLIRFWETYDSKHFTDGERAHIHTKINTICIAEPELEIMTFEEIENTASHEVAHLLNQTHDTAFQNIQSDTQSNLWKPPTGEGIVVVDSRDDEPIKGKKPEKKPRVVKSRCNYHLCKKKGKTYHCKYCKNYYCKKHRKPIEPDLSASFSVGELKGHPCLAYSNYLTKEKQKQDKEYEKTLGKMFGGKKKEDIFEEIEEEPKRKPKKGQKLKDGKDENIYEVSLKRLKAKKERDRKESFWSKIKNFFNS